MMSNIKGWIELLSLIVGLSGALFGALMWYRAAVEKSYAAERDFQYLNKNQEKIIHISNRTIEEMDRRFDATDKELIELRSWIQNLVILLKNDSNSSGFSKQDKPFS